MYTEVTTKVAVKLELNSDEANALYRLLDSCGFREALDQDHPALEAMYQLHALLETNVRNMN